MPANGATSRNRCWSAVFPSAPASCPIAKSSNEYSCVFETEPPDSTYQNWMLGQLDALDAALGGVR